MGRWQSKPAKATVPSGDKLNVHFKLIGSSKALSKQQSRLSNAKKKMTLSTKPVGIKIKKSSPSRPKIVKAKSAEYIGAQAQSRSVATPSCVVVTSSMPPAKSSKMPTQHKLSCSPIKGAFLFELGFQFDASHRGKRVQGHSEVCNRECCFEPECA